MSVSGLPSSSVSAGSGLGQGRELTARERVSLARAHRRALIASVLFVAVVALGVGAFAKLGSAPHTVLRTRHYASGQVHIAAHYTGSLKNGPYKEYNPDGSVKVTGAFVDDREDGPWRHHSGAGALESEGTMRHGVRDGPWEFFYIDGTRRTAASYTEGHLDGVQRRWYPSGALAEFEEYKDGGRHGRRLKYSDLDGTCLRDEDWAGGTLVEARNCFDQRVPVPPLPAPAALPPR